jgi:hypothetical protein
MDTNTPPLTHKQPAHRPRRKDREAASASASTRELVRLLVHEERSAQDLQRVLLTLSEQLKAETHRADAAELRAKEAAGRFQALNEARVGAQQEAARVGEELRLYKGQLEAAQREIFRAQDVVRAVEAGREEAERGAARARTTARRLQQERVVELAREEGRRVGFEEGVERGRVLALHGQGRYRTGLEDELLGEEYTSPVGESEAGTLVAPVFVSGVSGVEEQARPVVVHNVVAAPLPPPVNVPLDGFIPATGNDSVIRLPSPYELVGPQRSPSPPLPPIPEEEPMLMIPEPGSGSRRSSPRAAHAQYSPESNSTTISHLDIVSRVAEYVRSDARGSPLSAITEVVSAQASPQPGTTHVSNGRKCGTCAEARCFAQNVRPSVGTSRASEEAGGRYPARELYDCSDHASGSTSSTVPDITIQPPVGVSWCVYSVD